jgi:transposase
MDVVNCVSPKEYKPRTGYASRVCRVVLHIVPDSLLYGLIGCLRTLYRTESGYNSGVIRTSYPSDLTDEQWAWIEPYLRNKPKRKRSKKNPPGAPRRHEQREVVNAILYVLKTGCQWRQLPHHFPPWQIVYYHFRRWQRLGVWEQGVERLTRQDRRQARRKAPPTVAILDSQSVQTTQKGGLEGTMQGRKLTVASDMSPLRAEGRC